jgi:ABC-type transport system substrate-binding protein
MRILTSKAMILPFLALLVAGGVSMSVHTHAQPQAPTLHHLGFSPSVSPADSLTFRQALAAGLDRGAIFTTVAPYAPRPARPAMSIQHPTLPAYNPSVRGYVYDGTNAKDLLKQSAWTGTIVLSVAPPANRFRSALNDAVAASLRAALGALVTVQPAPNFKAFADAIKSGKAAVYVAGWSSDPADFGYPSFALGLAEFSNFPDPDLKALLAKRDAGAVEQMLLDKALIVPIVHL